LSYHSALLEILLALLVWGALFKLFRHLRRRKIRARLKETPFPKAYESHLEKLPHYPVLDGEKREKLKQRMALFLFDKEFIGIKNEVTDEMRAVIAFYACLITLELPEEAYEELKTVLVYPYRFIADEVQSYGGIYTQEEFVLEGQSTGDVVVISWHEAKREAYHLRHHNVIIHEFAHELDFEGGSADGVPPLDREQYRSWSHTIYGHYDILNDIWQKNRDWGRYALFGDYAATNRAEFFAVASEIFFTNPRRLKHEFPDIYNELARFYRQDPAVWNLP
jgi:hypothetical protein